MSKNLLKKNITNYFQSLVKEMSCEEKEAIADMALEAIVGEPKAPVTTAQDDDIFWGEKHIGREQRCSSNDVPMAIITLRQGGDIRIGFNPNLMQKIIDWQYIKAGLMPNGDLVFRQGNNKFPKVTRFSVKKKDGTPVARDVELSVSLKNEINKRKIDLLIGKYTEVIYTESPVKQFIIKSVGR